MSEHAARIGDAVMLDGQGAYVVAEALAHALCDNVSANRLITAAGLTFSDFATLRAVERVLREAAVEFDCRSSGNAATAVGTGEPSSSVMKTSAAAQLLGKSQRTVRGLALTGAIPSERIGGDYYFQAADVVAYAAGRAAA